MIVTLLLGGVMQVLTFVLGLLPGFTPPDWLAYSTGGWAFDIGAWVFKLGYWFPTELAGNILIVIGTAIPLVVGAGVVIWIWKMLPFT
jgi:hypothetical protein